MASSRNFYLWGANLFISRTILFENLWIRHWKPLRAERIYTIILQNFTSAYHRSYHYANGLTTVLHSNVQLILDILGINLLKRLNLEQKVREKNYCFSTFRYLFVSNMQEPIKKYKPQLLSKAICNLPVCVLKNQDWGSYRYLPTNDIRSTDAISDENQWFNNIQWVARNYLQNQK